MDEKKILLLRHGVTDWNAKLRFQGRTDIPLNTEGEAQASSVHSRVMAWKPEVVMVSPLGRAKRTAQIVTGLPQDALLIVDELIEISFGNWEGKGLLELKDDKEYKAWMDSPSSVSVANSEPIGDVMDRVGVVLEKIIETEAERFLLVSHGGTLRALIAKALGVPLDAMWKYFAFDNCALSGLTYKKGRFILKFYNDRLHCLCNGKSVSEIPLPMGF